MQDSLHKMQEEIHRRVLAEEEKRRIAKRRAEARKAAEESSRAIAEHLSQEEIHRIALDVEREYAKHQSQQNVPTDGWWEHQDIETLVGLAQVTFTEETIGLKVWRWLLTIFAMMMAWLVLFPETTSRTFNFILLLLMLFVVLGFWGNHYKQSDKKLAAKYCIRTRYTFFLRPKRWRLRYRDRLIQQWRKRGWSVLAYHDAGLLRSSYLVLKKIEE